MIVDILLAVGEKGGVENVINMLVPYLKKQYSWNVRVIQLIWEGKKWTDEEIQYYPLCWGKDGHTLDELVREYASFIDGKGVPDIVLATAWPYMCYVAKKALAMNANMTTKVISWVHAPIEQYKRAGFGGYEHLALADAHFAISKIIYDDIKVMLPGRSVWRVHNPVDFNKCICGKRRSDYKLNARRNLYFVGRVSREKRLDVIVNAIAESVDRWNLYVIGNNSDDYERQIRELVQEKEVTDYVQWLGWRENPWDYVTDADAVVLASEYEGFPLVAVEALANGIPVISTPVSGIVELIRPGENGYLYPFGDWNNLAKILQMISEGRLSDISDERCMESVHQYEAKIALKEMAELLKKIMK